jgi:phage baseplate assembly protein W
MAYVIGKKVVKDTTEFNDYAYGIVLPIAKGPTGYFEQAFTSFDQARSNLLNLLLTNKGERIMQPEFGTGLQELLFEQMTEDLEDRISDTITDSVNFWLPYINIAEIDVQMTDEMKDNNRANITISFTVGSGIQTREITFTIRG